FLRVGALGLALPHLLPADAPAAANSTAEKRSVLLVYLGGGLSHLDTFDPKPDAPTEVAGKYRPIATRVPNLRIGERLPQMAKIMDRVALVRSGSHDSDHHETAANGALSGRFGSAFGDYPAMGAVVAHETGFAGPV